MRVLFLSLLFFPLGHFLFGILMQLYRNLYFFPMGQAYSVQFFTLMDADIFGTVIYPTEYSTNLRSTLQYI